MSLEENKAAVRRFFEEFANQGNASVVDEIFSPTCVMHAADGADISGIEGAKTGYPRFRTAFPDVTYTIEDMMADGDKVAFRMTIEGTHTGKLGNIEPTGKKIKMTRFALIRFENDKWVEGWVLTNTLGLYQQLGAIPPTREIGK